MPAFVHDKVFNVALDFIKQNVSTLHICTGTPANLDDVTGSSLASVSLAPTDIELGDATPDGRGVTVAAKNGISVGGTGEPAHYCLVDGTDLVARAEVDPNSPGLTSGSTVNIPAVTFEIGDAVTETG